MDGPEMTDVYTDKFASTQLYPIMGYFQNYPTQNRSNRQRNHRLLIIRTFKSLSGRQSAKLSPFRASLSDGETPSSIIHPTSSMSNHVRNKASVPMISCLAKFRPGHMVIPPP